MVGQRLTGTPLYPSWGNADAFPNLSNLQLEMNHISSTLPPEWGQNGSWPSLMAL